MTSQQDIAKFQPDAVYLANEQVPQRFRVILYVLLAFIGAFITWSSITSIDRVVATGGQIVTPESNVVLRPYTKSYIAEIHVSEGQIVKAGDILITLDATFAKSDLSQIAGMRERAYAKYARLMAEFTGGELETTTQDVIPSGEIVEINKTIWQRRIELHSARLDLLDEAIAKAEAAIQTNETQKEALVNSLALLSDLEEEAKSSAEKMSAQRNVLIAENEYRRLSAQAEELQAGKRSAEANKNSYLQQRQQDLASELEATSSEIDQLDEEHQKAVRMAETVVIRCPDNVSEASVLDLHEIQRGGAVQEMQPLLTLVPLGTKLRAEIEIPVDEISHVTEGQTVRLKLNALPFQKHGALEGRIEHISEDAFSGESEQLHYKGTIELTSEVSDLSGLSNDVRLLPGMQLAADIKVGKRRIASYFLYPFLKTLDESFREP